MIDFPELQYPVAVVAEEPGKCDRIGKPVAEMGLIIPDARRPGPHAGEDGSAGRAADRELAVCAVEPHPLCRKSVNIRRPADRIAVTAQAHVQVVADNKCHVFFLGGRMGKHRRERKGCAGEGERCEGRPAGHGRGNCWHI